MNGTWQPWQPWHIFEAETKHKHLPRVRQLEPQRPGPPSQQSNQVEISIHLVGLYRLSSLWWWRYAIETFKDSNGQPGPNRIGLDVAQVDLPFALPDLPATKTGLMHGLKNCAKCCSLSNKFGLQERSGQTVGATLWVQQNKQRGKHATPQPTANSWLWVEDFLNMWYTGARWAANFSSVLRGTSESSARSVPKTGLTKSQRKSYVPPNNNLMVSCHSCCWSEPRLSHGILLAGFSCRSLCDLRLQKLTPKKQTGGNKEANCVPCSLALQLVTSSIYFFGLSEMRSMWLCSHGEAVLLYLVVSRVGPERSCVRLWFIWWPMDSGTAHERSKRVCDQEGLGIENLPDLPQSLSPQCHGPDVGAHHPVLWDRERVHPMTSNV